MRSGATRKCKIFIFDKEKPAAGTGGTDSNLGLCLQQGARGIVEIEARETLTKDPTKPDGIRTGDCPAVQRGANVVTVLTATTALFSQPGTVNTAIVSYCCLAMHYCLVPASVVCMLRATIKHGHDGPTVRAVAP